MLVDWLRKQQLGVHSAKDCPCCFLPDDYRINGLHGRRVHDRNLEGHLVWFSRPLRLTIFPVQDLWNDVVAILAATLISQAVHSLASL